MKKLKLAASTLAITIAIGAGMTTTHYVNAASSTDSAEQQDSAALSGKRGAFKGERTGEAMRGEHGNPWLVSGEIADALGLTAEELKAEVQSGKTLTAIAEERNVDVETVKAAIVELKTAKLAEQLSEGKLTQDQYDQRISELSNKAEKLVNGELSFKKGGKGAPGHHGGLKNIGGSEEVAKVLGLSEDELKTEVQSGKTLATIAEERNVDVETVKAAIVELKTAKLDEQLSEGKLTQEQYEQRLAELSDKAEKLVNSEPKRMEPAMLNGRDNAGNARPGRNGKTEESGSADTAE